MRACGRRGTKGNGADPGATTDVGEPPQKEVGPAGDGEVEVEQVIEWDDDEQAVEGEQADPTTS